MKKTQLAQVAPLLLFIKAIEAIDGQGLGQCFGMTDGARLSDEYQPCLNTKTSFCCATNRTIPYGGPDAGPGHWSSDVCISLGFCKKMYQGSIEYWRIGCKDANYEGPECSLSICKAVVSRGELRMTPCDDNRILSGSKWCCGYNNKKCCGVDAIESGYIFNDVATGSTSTPLSPSFISTSLATPTTWMTTQTATPLTSPAQTTVPLTVTQTTGVVKTLVLTATPSSEPIAGQPTLMKPGIIVAIAVPSLIVVLLAGIAIWWAKTNKPLQQADRRALTAVLHEKSAEERRRGPFEMAAIRET
ncbi:hypothetical protein BGZ60DRAFT_425230 [Tricladium varicosporioides]|nr:hypothetical protein BGZ60DRAFT_425230 [Hymenoscyphus varicosporioides]